MRSSASIAAIAPDLVAALGEMEGVAREGENPAFKRDSKPMKYATLDAVILASREVLTKHNIGLMQWPGAVVDGKLSLETILLHKSGEWVAGDFEIYLGKLEPQGIGSALTYARRYAQKAALNLPDLDDDAEASKGGEPKRALWVTAACSAITCMDDISQVDPWWKANVKMIKDAPQNERDEVMNCLKNRKAALTPKPTAAEQIADDEIPY